MQENENVNEELPEASEEELEEFGSIFTDEAKVIEGQRKSAEALGIDPDLVAREDGSVPVQYLARKNCKHCYGRGFVTMVPSPQKQKVFWVNKGPMGYRKTGGSTPPKMRVITGISPANEELTNLWDDRDLTTPRSKRRQKAGKSAEKFRGTSRPEPPDYKDEARQQFLCRCVKVEEAA